MGIAAAGGTVSVRVVLADDQALIRVGLRALADAEPDIEVVGEAADGQEAVEMAEQHRPDVVLMDLSLPVLSGVAATKRIRTLVPGTHRGRINSLAFAPDGKALAVGGLDDRSVRLWDTANGKLVRTR